MESQTCTRCYHSKPKSFFLNKFGTKAVAQCSTCRENHAIRKKKQTVTLRSPLKEVDSNIQRRRRRDEDDEILNPLSQALSLHSPLRKRRRSPQPALEETLPSPKRKLRPRDEVKIYRDFSSSVGSSPISSLSSAHLLTPRSPRNLLAPFTIFPQVLIDTGPRPTNPPEVGEPYIHYEHDRADDQDSLFNDSDGDDPDDQHFLDIDQFQSSGSSFHSSPNLSQSCFGSFPSSQAVEEEEAYNERVKELPAAHIARLREVEYDDLESMDLECRFCYARHWAFERTNRNVVNPELFNYVCCANGDVQLDDLPPPPPEIQELLEGDTVQAKHFQKKIVEYNNAFAFTSMCYTPDTRVTSNYSTFQIRDQLYHAQGPIDTHTRVAFTNTYIHDAQTATKHRYDFDNELDQSLLLRLHNLLLRYNPFISLYKTARECLRVGSGPQRVLLNPQMQLVMEQGADKRRANLPTSDEMAIFIPDEVAAPGQRDMVLAQRDQPLRDQEVVPVTDDVTQDLGSANPNGLIRVQDCHAGYIPLHYVLLFPKGTPGWHPGLQYARGDRKRTRLPNRKYWQYHLHSRTYERPTYFSPLLHSQRLFQRLMVDLYATLEAQQLAFLRFNQKKLRADSYASIQTALGRADFNPANTGKIVLPSTFIGGDRFMQGLLQDSMAIVRHFGKPTIFLTYTTNPTCPEIKRELGPGEKPLNRPDIVCCVFEMKRRSILLDLDHCFGHRIGHVWTIEYQKRGLPHIHILLFLSHVTEWLNPEYIDNFIKAELPSPQEDPTGIITAIVQTCMTHTPCGPQIPNAECMVDDGRGGKKCKRGFPKPFCEETRLTEDGFPTYQRRDDGRTWQVKNFTADNRWVVPYNPYMLKKYGAYINIEICSSVQAIKYIHKYVYKGCDVATMSFRNPNDEIERHLQGRYIGAQQAFNRLFEYLTHDEKPPVQRLDVHLEGEQPIMFEPASTPQQVQDAARGSTTSLMAYFNYNATYPEAHHILYHDFPNDHALKRFKGGRREWVRRKRDTFSIGRMYWVYPQQGDLYFLRLLLTQVTGSTSFEDLRVFNGTRYDDYQSVCRARGLLTDDAAWISNFDEASTCISGTVLRQSFAFFAANCGIENPAQIWDQFKDHFCDDLDFQIRVKYPEVQQEDYDYPLKYDYGLYLIGLELAQADKVLTDIHLPMNRRAWEAPGSNRLIAEEMNYDAIETTEQASACRDKFNDAQREAFNTITEKVDNDPEHAHFFLQGAGGTGKTFLYRAICAHYRSQGAIVLCVASSGIAALLLPGGRTSHSRFKIPLKVYETSSCSLKKQTIEAELIQKTKLVIWDEVPMQHKNCIEAVNNSFKDLMDNQADFGGIPVVFGGDFAQTLPIVPRGSRAQQVNASIRNSTFWYRLTQLHLYQNTRLGAGGENAEFAKWLGNMSYNESQYGLIELPKEIKARHFDEDALCEDVYPTAQISGENVDSHFLKDRAILTLKNTVAEDLSRKVLDRMSGESRTYLSNNSTDSTFNYPAEYLNTVRLASLPPHELTLKKNAVIMLLRNIQPTAGLANGTRVKVLHMGQKFIKVMILGGSFHGAIHVLFRVKLNTTEGELPYTLVRQQFPVRLCFAITINKSQGQSLGKVGVDLRLSVFSHGQFYVALSRVTDVSQLSVLIRDKIDQRTINIVWAEVLLHRQARTMQTPPNAIPPEPPPPPNRERVQLPDLTVAGPSRLGDLG